jgi:two-component system cell cycle sensor histidine kinase/response regulator CckA
MEYSDLGTVLVIDDDDSIRRFIARTLVRAGYTFVEASSAQQGLQAIERLGRTITLVISDISMPGGSGLDLANDLAKSSPHLPILYISGLVESVAVESIARQEPTAILQKPFRGEQLLDRVRLLIERVPHDEAPSATPAVSAKKPPLSANRTEYREDFKTGM